MGGRRMGQQLEMMEGSFGHRRVDQAPERAQRKAESGEPKLPVSPTRDTHRQMPFQETMTQRHPSLRTGETVFQCGHPSGTDSEEPVFRFGLRGETEHGPISLHQSGRCRSRSRGLPECRMAFAVRAGSVWRVACSVGSDGPAMGGHRLAA